MTAHATNRWNLDMPVDEVLVNEVASCVGYNRTSHGFTPLCFAIMSTTDAMVYNLGLFLDRCKTVVDESAIKEFIAGSDDLTEEQQKK